MWDVSGMHGAAPVWLSVMNRLHAATPSLPPPLPAGVEARQINFEQHTEAARREYFFLPGTAQDVVYAASSDSRSAVSAITNPVDGSVYALDPDIPPQHQRVVFRSSGVAQPQWWLDGKWLGRGAHLPWFPMPGRHVLQMRDGSRVIGEAHFEVRGATLKPPTPRRANSSG